MHSKDFVAPWPSACAACAADVSVPPPLPPATVHALPVACGHIPCSILSAGLAGAAGLALVSGTVIQVLAHSMLGNSTQASR